MMKKLILTISLFLFLCMGSISFAKVPTFDNNFSNYMTDRNPDSMGRKEAVFDLCIDKTKSFKENIRILFYPNVVNPDSDCASSSGGVLWDIIRILGFAMLVISLVMIGITFLTEGDSPDKIKKAGKGLILILYGAFLFFGATWLLGSNMLNVENLTGTADLVNKLQGNGSLFFKILSFFKALAFFVAILMVVYYGFKMMSAMDKEDKIKSARKGIMNVLIALIFIKFIDYVYYIAQLSSFVQKTSELILQIAKIMAYLLGASFVIALFYAGFTLITSGGNDESFKKAKNILVGIILSSFVIFLFILIIYQVFKEFA